MRIAAVLLAAGRGSRFIHDQAPPFSGGAPGRVRGESPESSGEPPVDASGAFPPPPAGSSPRTGGSPIVSKLLADLGGRPVIDWAAAAIEAAGLSPRVAVVRPGDEGVRVVVAARGFEAIENPRADEGMGTSIAAGAAWAAERGMDGVLIALGDAPFVTAKLLGALAAKAGGEAIVAALDERLTTAAVVGPPIVFPAVCFPELVALDGDQGARSVMRRRTIASLRAAPGELDDVDTPEALEAARKRLAAG